MGMKYMIDDVVLFFLGEDNIPAVGLFFYDKSDAVRVANEYLAKIEQLGLDSYNNKCRVNFLKQRDGRYSLILMNDKDRLEIIKNLDELMLKRFRKSLQKKFFVVTTFFKNEDGEIDCLAVTDGLGAVLFSIN